MTTNLANFIKTLTVFLAIDLVYLGIIRRDFMFSYFKKINCGQKPVFRMLVGLGAWALLALALERWIIHRRRGRRALLDAALLGLIIYGVYDLSNKATINAWTWMFSIQDMIWGAVLLAAVTWVRQHIWK